MDRNRVPFSWCWRIKDNSPCGDDKVRETQDINGSKGRVVFIGYLENQVLRVYLNIDDFVS